MSLRSIRVQTMSNFHQGLIFTSNMSNCSSWFAHSNIHWLCFDYPAGNNCNYLIGNHDYRGRSNITNFLSNIILNKNSLKWWIWLSKSIFMCTFYDKSPQKRHIYLYLVNVQTPIPTYKARKTFHILRKYMYNIKITWNENTYFCWAMRKECK